MTRKSQQLTLEALEDRTLLSTCHVTRVGDFGAGGVLGNFARGDLRFCINYANNNPGADTIDFKVTGTIKLNSALPGLADELTIAGPGADNLAIDAQQKDRVFYVEDGTVEILGLTLTGGYSDAGGGIYNEGTLTLRDSAVVGNKSSPRSGYYARGGGIYNAGGLTIEKSVISDNLAIRDIFSGYAQGGGIYNTGGVLIVDSTISANSSYGGVYAHGGAIQNYLGEVTVLNSLIANNTIFGDYAYGGGVNNWANLTLINSTISGNSANKGHYDPIESSGGGISTSKPLTIRYCTIADNHANNVGGGIADWTNEADTYVYNTIVAKNVSGVTGTNKGNDFSGVELGSSGYNIFGDSAGVTGYDATDQLNVDPMLGPLQDNGGLTWTMALLPGGPAIDAGDPNPVDPPEWDQRGPGYPRIVNGRLDIGAFEVQATEAPGTPSHFAVLITADLEFKLEDLT